MAQSITLTPMEEQVLQALATLFPQRSHTSDAIRSRGALKFGSEWGGRPRRRTAHPASCTYPTVNATLGRLAKKGLVQRQTGAQAELLGYQAGAWQLTEWANDLLGVNPACVLGVDPS